jgi:hypothetical protein
MAEASVMSVVPEAGGDHHDGDIGAAADGSAHLEAVDPRQHDVDQHHVGRLSLEVEQRVLAGGRLGDRPALVLERELHGRADALVVLYGEDPRAQGLVLDRDAGTDGIVACGWS